MTYGCMVKLQCNKIMTKYAKQSFLKSMPKIKHFIYVSCWKRKKIKSVLTFAELLCFSDTFRF